MRILIVFGCLNLFFLFFSCNNSVKKEREGEIKTQHYNTPPITIELSDGLTKEDSLLYTTIVEDYGNYWETTTSNKINRKVLFNFYSGYIVIYINKSVATIENQEPAEHVLHGILIH